MIITFFETIWLTFLIFYYVGGVSFHSIFIIISFNLDHISSVALVSRLETFLKLLLWCLTYLVFRSPHIRLSSLRERKQGEQTQLQNMC